MILILLSSWSATSQSDILNPEVRISRSVAIATVKDLERYDGLKIEYDLLNRKVNEMVKIIQQKDDQIREDQDVIGRLNLVVNNHSAMQKMQETKYQNLQKQYTRSVRAGRFKIVLLVGVAAFGIYQTFK